MKFFKSLVIFIKNLRDCTNLLGWDVLSQYKELSAEPTDFDFTTLKNAEHIPEIIDDFVNIFLKNNLPQFDKHLAVVLVSHFCDWLYKYKFTNIKINLDDKEQNYENIIF